MIQNLQYLTEVTAAEKLEPQKNMQQLFMTEKRKKRQRDWDRNTTSLFRDILNCYHVSLQVYSAELII